MRFPVGRERSHIHRLPRNSINARILISTGTIVFHERYVFYIDIFVLLLCHKRKKERGNQINAKEKKATRNFRYNRTRESRQADRPKIKPSIVACENRPNFTRIKFTKIGWESQETFWNYRTMMSIFVEMLYRQLPIFCLYFFALYAILYITIQNIHLHL